MKPDEILDGVVEAIGTSPYKADEIKLAAKLFSIKQRAAYLHTPSAKFNGSITLFKAADSTPTIDDNYGLSKVCTPTFRIDLDSSSKYCKYQK